uniref:tetratricopeptide repeat protein n=1 Tax=Rhodothermus marinus TaxID=29549 RepID=UPI000A4A78F4
MLRIIGRLCTLSMLFLGPVALRAQPAPPGPSVSFAHALALHSDGFYTLSAQTFAQFRSTYPNDPRVPEALFYEAERGWPWDRPTSGRPAPRLRRPLPDPSAGLRGSACPG